MGAWGRVPCLGDEVLLGEKQRGDKDTRKAPTALTRPKQSPFPGEKSD